MFYFYLKDDVQGRHWACIVHGSITIKNVKPIKDEKFLCYCNNFKIFVILPRSHDHYWPEGG